MNKFIITSLIILAFGLYPNSSYSQEQIENTTIKTGKTTVLPYNYLNTTSIPIYVAITKEISTKDGIIEGSEADFRIIKDVVHNNKTILKEGQIIKGKIETVITSGMNGFPAEIIVDNFEIPNIKKSQLISTYTKKGQNRCFWVYPLKWSLTLIPFVGSLTNLIMGGHAYLKTTDIITIYYYPEWI